MFCLMLETERKIVRERRRQARETDRQTRVSVFTEKWNLAATRSRHEV